MKFCDAHVHLGSSGPWQPYMKPSIYIEELMQRFVQNNVERAVVFPNPNVGDRYPQTNDYIAECVGKHPKELVGFGRVDPRRGREAVEELVRIKKELSLIGLKLHPVVECFRPDHPYFKAFFQKANAMKIPIVIHTGNGFSSPGRAAKIAEKHSNIIMILAHLSEGCLAPLKRLENVYVETSGTRPEIVELAVDVDENRVLFGSDTPYLHYTVEKATVQSANIQNKTRRKIFYENFQRLFQQES